MIIDITEMNTIVVIATCMLVVEIFLTIFFLVAVYFLKIYYIFANSRREIAFDKIKKIMIERTEFAKNLDKSDINLMRRNILATIAAYEYMSESYMTDFFNFNLIGNQVIELIFKNKIKSLSRSYKTYKRYFAAKIINFSMEEQYNEIAADLINDKRLLISITASKAAFKFLSPELINVAITVFSKYRRLQQSVFSNAISTEADGLEKIILDRIESDKNPYAKSFCYKLLLNIKPRIDPINQTKKDMNSNVLELRLSALNYAAHNPMLSGMVKNFLNDSDWQVRAIAAKLIGQIKDESCINELSNLLHDKQWWVRIRTAESLKKLGEKGIEVLKAQSIEKDKYAYEAAMQALIEGKDVS